MMNKDIAEGKWKELKGDAQSKWGQLTDDDLDEIAGNRDRYVGIVQKKYGKSKDEAEKEFDEFMRDHNLH